MPLTTRAGAGEEPVGLVDEEEDVERRFAMFFTAFRIREPPDGVMGRPVSGDSGLEECKGSTGAGDTVRSG